MGCRKFRNYKHLLQVSRDGAWVDGGEFPASLGSYATIPKSHRGKPLDRRRYKYLDAVHMDIAFGDCVAVGGYRYTLVLVDRATRYNWNFGLKTLSASDILSALCLFRAAAGRLARCFYTDCDLKLFGTAISEYLIDNDSKVVAAPAKRQSSNGLVELHWKVMVHMARVYLTEKQMPRAFWFYAVTHAARMMNAIPISYQGQLASPFLLVHGVGHDERTWVPLFSLCFFIMNATATSPARTIRLTRWTVLSSDGPLPPRCSWCTTLPNDYRVDPYRLPGSAYPTLKYDGGLFVNLLCDDNPHFEEKYPPGTRVERMDPASNMLCSGTVMDIPFPLSSSLSSEDSTDLPYTILFDDGTTATVPLSKMADLIPPPLLVSTSPNSVSALVPPFLQLNSEITYEHEG
jgi:hypothetical protein